MFEHGPSCLIAALATSPITFTAKAFQLRSSLDAEQDTGKTRELFGTHLRGP